ncbi:MAG: J domain-containing protein [Thermoproteota archaeon]|nr:J domain-containing protein [Thermoproteota archaeon]
MESTDHYKTLGVLEQASHKEIKSAYRRLARKFHPDRNSNVSDDVMKNINIAFEVLSDPEKRNQYDRSNFDDLTSNKDVVNESYGDKNNIDIASRGIQTKYESSSSNTDTTIYDYSNYYPDGDNINFNSQESPSSSTFNYLDIPTSRYQIIVEPSLCLAFGSCETLAPKVFVVEKNKRINPKAVVKSETGADFETILDAAKTCPTKAIIIIDRYSGERIYP